MSLTHRQHHQLCRIEAGLLRSDPKLAGMLGLFGRLSAGQGLPAWERVPARRDHVRQAAASLTAAIKAVATAARLLRVAMAFLVAATTPVRRRQLSAGYRPFPPSVPH